MLPATVDVCDLLCRTCAGALLTGEGLGIKFLALNHLRDNRVLLVYIHLLTIAFERYETFSAIKWRLGGRRYNPSLQGLRIIVGLF